MKIDGLKVLILDLAKFSTMDCEKKPSRIGKIRNAGKHEGCCITNNHKPNIGISRDPIFIHI